MAHIVCQYTTAVVPDDIFVQYGHARIDTFIAPLVASWERVVCAKKVYDCTRIRPAAIYM